MIRHRLAITTKYETIRFNLCFTARRYLYSRGCYGRASLCPSSVCPSQADVYQNS